MVKFCRNCSKVLPNPTDENLSELQFEPAVKATAFCRYCGHPTSVADVTCLHCGSSIKPLPNSVRTLFEHPRLSTKMGKVVNLSIVSVMVASYVVFSLPKTITKPVKQAASDAVAASTGYTALPLNSITASPPLIPELYTYYFYYTPPGIAVNSTRQITIYAVYKNTNAENATKAIRIVDVTNNCTYRSSDDRVATCNASGVVLATGVGAANITAFYTAAPGTADMYNAAEGKVPVTFTTSVTVFVK